MILLSSPCSLQKKQIWENGDAMHMQIKCSVCIPTHGYSDPQKVVNRTIIGQFHTSEFQASGLAHVLDKLFMQITAMADNNMY